MNPTVVRAICRRNFVSYFSNPTGYVFICVFVLLCGIAAFWPNEFFNRNLANLDQLNTWLPYILLVFIPAITMSLWAQERQQGTDELLLTIPASDFDVVLGKYLAAVGIYSVSLLFSLSLIIILLLLGRPDMGLVVSNYFGYWLVGLAMLSIGMVASFLTDNLTVGFILGALFNAPLVFAAWATTISGLLGRIATVFFFWGEAITGNEVAQSVARWSIGHRFDEFGRGVVSFSAVMFFLLIVAWSLYLSMVLIGRRHWMGGREGRTLVGHFSVRTVALALVVVAVNVFLARAMWRVDVTSERLSSLSPKTVALLDNLENDRGVQIDAYISPVVPESYVQTRESLINVLQEFDVRGGNQVSVQIYSTEPHSETAATAEELYGITGQEITSRNRGTMNIEEIYLGVAVTSGLDRVVIPFFDRGIPAEYELIRSIATVSDQERRKIGVLATDAKLLGGGFDMQSMTSRPNEQIIDELEKQYEVVQVNADSPIADEYDVLLAVQPSSLTQPQMDNFVAAVSRGIPTAIFEDPFPYIDLTVPGTAQPRRPPGGNPFMQQQQMPQEPKGSIAGLWEMLGIRFVGDQVVRQSYNPYPKIGQFPPEFVFVDSGQDEREGVKPAFNSDDVVSSQMQQLLFLFPGTLQELSASTGLTFESLVLTGSKTGLVRADEIVQQTIFGGPGGLNPQRTYRITGTQYVLAARIHGPLPAAQPPADLSMSAAGFQDEGASEDSDSAETAGPAAPDETAESETPAAPAADESDDAQPAPDAAEPDAATDEMPAEPAEAPLDAAGEDDPPADEPPPPPAPQRDEIDVVIVSDIDVLYSAFFALRARGDEPDAEVNLQLDNVNFVLNVLDTLADDERFIEIRSRRPQYRTLDRFEALTAEFKDQTDEARAAFVQDFENGRDFEQEAFDKRIAEIEQQAQEQQLDTGEVLRMVELARRVGQRRLDATIARLEQKRDSQIRLAETDYATRVRSYQDFYKLLAVLLPPILPLGVGAVVFFNRRVRENEGVAQSRLR